MDHRSAFISCRDLHKSFNRNEVLRGVSLDVYSGETLVILGASGEGKSVLLKHMNGLLKPDRGAVWVAGQDITGMGEDALTEIRKQVGMLFQGGALFDSLTVGENVAYPLWEHARLPREAVRDRVREVLAMVDLSDSEPLLPSELSGGMRKRAALARSLALQPKAILYDEPTTGLDPIVGRRINALIRRLQAQLGLTSVVVTHDLAGAFSVMDRLAFLREGQISFVGAAEEVRRSPDPALREFLEAYA